MNAGMQAHDSGAATSRKGGGGSRVCIGASPLEQERSLAR
jgi:hypothetical protein